MTRYRKRPIVVDAIHYRNLRDSAAAVRAFVGDVKLHTGVTVPGFKPAAQADWTRMDSDVTGAVYDVLHDTWVGVKDGQWIIRGVRGEMYPCADDVFRGTYEPVEDAA